MRVDNLVCSTRLCEWDRFFSNFSSILCLVLFFFHQNDNNLDSISKCNRFNGKILLNFVDESEWWTTVSGERRKWISSENSLELFMQLLLTFLHTIHTPRRKREKNLPFVDSPKAFQIFIKFCEFCVLSAALGELKWMWTKSKRRKGNPNWEEISLSLAKHIALKPQPPFVRLQSKLLLSLTSYQGTKFLPFLFAYNAVIVAE